MATLIGCRFFRKSWSARLPTPSSHTRHQSPLRFSEKRGRSRSYLFLSPTRWARVSSPACPAQAVISPGFVHTEGEFAGKLLELLTEIAPTVKRVAIMFNPDTAPGRGSSYLPSFETAARSFGLEAIAAPVRNDAEIQAIVAMLGREEGGGLVAMPDGFTLVHRAPMILQAARNKIPAVYWNAIMARDGGLLSYGPDTSDIFRRAAPYFDRILRGEKPGDLPVQAPTKFELVINLKTAKALGIEVPLFFQQRADEVIE